MRSKNDVLTLRYARSFERLQLRTSGFKYRLAAIGPYMWKIKTHFSSLRKRRKPLFTSGINQGIMLNHRLRANDLLLCHDTFVDNDTYCRVSFDIK